MRIAVVYIPAKGPEPLAAVAKAMARIFEASGHFVDVSEAKSGESPRLTGYDYIVVGTESATVLGKIPDRLAPILAQSGRVSGKRCMAFLRKSGFRSEKALSRLMKVMESEGMIVNFAEVLANEEDAARAAKKAPLVRN